jgi:Fanconi anemia group M protein
VEYPVELIEIKGLLVDLYNEKMDELKHRGITYSIPNKIILLALQKRLMNELRSSKDGNKMQGVSLTSQALKISHAIELIETQTISSFIEYLRSLYKQSSEKKSSGVQKVTKDPRFTKAFTLATSLNIEHPKIYALENEIKEKIKENKNAKIIIFAQFRETVKKIKEVLNKINGIKSEIFVGQSQKKNSKGETTGLKQSQQKEMIEKFKNGEINVLIATSIGEEGLDIPEVSMVLFYEPVPSAIRKIQRAGRTARLTPGTLKILITKNTRDEIYHYSSSNKEKRMYKAIDNIKKDFKTTPKENQLTLTNGPKKN